MAVPRNAYWVKQLLFTLGVLVLFNLPNVARAETRMALVIGNDAYEALEPLNNPVRDAETIGETLSALGFRVYLATNLDAEKQAQAFAFFQRKSAEADTVVVYFAGHGTTQDDALILMPTNARADAGNGHSVADIQNGFTNPDQRRILIFDTCQTRLDPDADDQAAPVKAIAPQLNSYIVTAAAPGKEAYDGPGRHSLLAGALLDNITRSDLDIDLMFRNVRRDVLRNSGGAQMPVVSSALVAPFTFAPTGAADAQFVQTAPQSGIQALNETGFGTKPVLDEMAAGLQPDIVLNKAEATRLKAKLKLCQSITGPLPKACLKAVTEAEVFLQ